MKTAVFVLGFALASAAKPEEVNILIEAPAAQTALDQMAVLLRAEQARTSQLESLVSTGKPVQSSFLSVSSAPVPRRGDTMKNRLFTTEPMGASSLSVNIVESANEPVSATVANAFAEGNGPWKRIVIPAHHGFQASKDAKHTIFNVHIPEAQAGLTQEQQQVLAGLQRRSQDIAALMHKSSSFVQVAQPIRLGGSDASQLVGEAVDIANHVVAAPQGQAASPSGDITGKAAGAANDAKAAARAMASFLSKGRHSFLANGEFDRDTQSPMVWLNLHDSSKGTFLASPAGTPPYSVVDIYLEEGPSRV